MIENSGKRVWQVTELVITDDCWLLGWVSLEVKVVTELVLIIGEEDFDMMMITAEIKKNW